MNKMETHEKDISLLASSGRAKGVADFAVNFEPGGQAPLDARLLVPTKADLIKPETYAAKNYYRGMAVTVEADGTEYVLMDPSKISSPDYSGWKQRDSMSTASSLPETLITDLTNVTTNDSTAVIHSSKVTKIGDAYGEAATNDIEIPAATKTTAGIMTAAQVNTLETHVADKENPHGVTKDQVGLGNVTNDVQVKRSEMGVASGVATLDKAGKIPTAQYGFADEEDVTFVGDKLKLKDRNYDAASHSGLGYVILRKNMGTGKNILSQEAIGKANTIYEIRYDFDLNGGTITIPEGCILKFVGGSLTNGTVNGNNTLVVGEYKDKLSTITRKQLLDSKGNDILAKTEGTFDEKPVVANGLCLGFGYFCSDLKSFGGDTGRMIYHRGNDIWIDANGVVINKEYYQSKWMKVDGNGDTFDNGGNPINPIFPGQDIWETIN